MSVNIYSCAAPGSIVPFELAQENSLFVFSQYFIVEKYEYQYQREIKRFNMANTPYALPAIGKTIRPYCGFDRMPLLHTPDDAEEISLEEITEVFNSLSEKEQCEIIYVNIVDSGIAKPKGMTFLGYDVCYPPDRDGFSIICDCMFLCRWHGCDMDGTEFKSEFEKLNENGLFSNKEDAISYMYHYLSQEWAETGEFCILEIYKCS